ncbi:MAG: Low specificity phosphatase (HAD superfamily)-like protein [Candidatus Amesbacteria bacterium GW2011_GWB1_47_19]|nr:MAG: Low specificity phosphatase (HAD superfamily)-like protein [Candidatus Amesbacteria bacterium GW2011_GWA1_44_24]KKU31717.1 MAG: hypothetical protein UX46_C0003G0042 [Candidatus Amesbacteria bacterium GW2011_GWC1_46_24]KKU67630.1 MAG: Low specificity phosphatase (HAD superfamily)-like protein [Candidatus Amesbacteria bacterium GW2011_GWB1_47_19]OGD06480.1 MAG: phosphatase [Candidatus Amesbacteria bacterium RIFOXYB1_FULL_47_13]HBC72883.1 phosphatase [Candidatus Amesbacteria bacterium]
MNKMKNFIIDVDGVLTDGQFHYSAEGKIMKVFGPDDADALALLKEKMYIHMISGDKRGFPITKKRVAEDMKFPLNLVSTFERIEWIKNKFNPSETIYIGDGIYDALVFKEVGYSIAVANACDIAKKYADFVTVRKGAEGAVAEAALHIMDKFFEPIDLNNLKPKHGSGVWKSGKQ